MSVEHDKLRDRLRFAVNARRDALNTLALVRQGRLDVIGTGTTHREARELYRIEEDLAARRVREWERIVSTLAHSAEFFGFGLDDL